MEWPLGRPASPPVLVLVGAVDIGAGRARASHFAADDAIRVAVTRLFTAKVPDKRSAVGLRAPTPCLAASSAHAR